MTQLVGALCDDGKKVITVSDRMVSTGDMTLTFEQPKIKAVQLSEKSVVLTAGTVHEPDLIRQAKVQARGLDRVLGIAEVLKEVYQEIREKHIVDEVLRPQTGLRSLAEWRAEQRRLHDGIIMGLNEEISGYRLRLSLLLAGYDDEGHIISIGDPGTYRSYDNLGYCCMGMGDRHADNVFAWYRYSRVFPLKDALFIAFEAKKRSEMAGGVGKSTDILVIDNEGVKEVAQSTIQSLEDIYNEREARAERTGFDKRVSELEVQTELLEAPAA